MNSERAAPDQSPIRSVDQTAALGFATTEISLSRPVE